MENRNDTMDTDIRAVAQEAENQGEVLSNPVEGAENLSNFVESAENLSNDVEKENNLSNDVESGRELSNDVEKDDGEEGDCTKALPRTLWGAISFGKYNIHKELS